ncbi:MAG: type III-B CRISPR module RAMP protein Cmr6 [Deltaproteobacteria bacterium RIFOXYD12_FULL_50_9]|nr:MAG: type III-B CRISPR module RAMP protein Cmr6 [Deltaproteobacteria bacterium RIFOXYD12_FULL_50_9]
MPINVVSKQFRMVSSELSTCLASADFKAANFGLYHNRFLQYHEDFERKTEEPRPNRDPRLDSKVSFHPEAHNERGDELTIYREARPAQTELLKKIHIRQAHYCTAMKKTGWIPIIIHARLTSPFITGMGIDHPTETNLLLDRNTGVPFIPASGQKGVMRLALMFDSLQDRDGNWRDEGDLLAEKILIHKNNKKTKETELHWNESPEFKTLFGFLAGKEDNDGCAGNLVILDAYPVTPPEIGTDILNPHYPEYYRDSGKKRGPTEDQSPIPIKFLVVKEGAEFVFRVLLRPLFSASVFTDREQLRTLAEWAIINTIEQHGIGGKTAIGYGHFKMLSQGNEPAAIIRWTVEEEGKQTKLREKREQELKPWLAVIKQITDSLDWGQLKQNALDNEKVKAYQTQSEVASAVKSAAERIRGGNPKKWNEEKRDQLMADWLAQAGLTWEPLVSTATQAASSLSPNETAAVEQIKGLKEWDDYLKTKINPTDLPRPALQALRDKMKNDWNCENGKKPKKDALKQVKALLRPKP